MHIDLEVQAVARGGVFTRGEAVAAGYTDNDLFHLVRRGDWRRLRRGRYVTSQTWDEADEVGRLALRCHATVATGRRALLSHATSAALQRLPVVMPDGSPPDHDRLHLTVPRPPGSRPRVGVRTHHGATDRHEVTVHGLVMTSPLRTAHDLARLHGETTGVIAADAALHRGSTPDDLVRMVEELAHWPGSSSTRRLVGLVDAGAESPGESMARLLVASLRLGTPTSQARISDGSRTAVVDLLLGRLVIEFDGRVKYGDARQHGRDRPVEDILWSEKQREDWIRSQGYLVVRLTWADLWPPRREATLMMLREKLVIAQQHAA